MIQTLRTPLIPPLHTPLKLPKISTVPIYPGAFRSLHGNSLLLRQCSASYQSTKRFYGSRGIPRPQVSLTAQQKCRMLSSRKPPTKQSEHEGGKGGLLNLLTECIHIFLHSEETFITDMHTGAFFMVAPLITVLGIYYLTRAWQREEERQCIKRHERRLALLRQPD